MISNCRKYCSYVLYTGIKIVVFYEARNSVVATQRKFYQHCNVRRSPSFKTIKSIVAKFKTRGLIFKQQKGASGRPEKCRTVENIETVRLSVIGDPKKSYWKRAPALARK